MASYSATNTGDLRLKLLIDTKNNKVLFAEASKDVVDFLFTLLQFPLATVVKLLSKEAVVGSLGNLYSSVENLNHIYMQPNLSKDLFLNPTILPSSPFISGLLTSVATINKPSQITSKLYKCNYGCGSSAVTDVYNSVCSNCRYDYCGDGGRMTAEVKYIKGATTATAATAPATNNYNNGFVKEVITYMIMDNLVIQPMSTISSITMLNQFNVKDVGVLKEAVFHLGINEGLKLLKASMESETVLTSVFLAS
ncbi:hypothetical protein PIB30_013261 [Stylosanthes scabra]|uniref:DUF674 domain-containing protein n=1 Tax=Stylosanthes scabra TaxID=79078 RepID=A0ABU6R711_9FABA|nr:hypothetical protein [Stylosanthes scabra]